MIKPDDHKHLPDLRDPVVYAFILLLIVTFFVYLKLLDAGFLDYDDLGNVVQNQSITSFSMKNISTIFTTAIYYSYNPVTFLSYAIENQLFGLNPAGFHFTNILLHLLNILLVFRFIRLLSGSRNVALGVAAIFALHPIHSDVVGWISARNYLLCTLFYLSSLIFYIQHLKLRRKSTFSFRLLLSFLFFILACLSKSQAVTLAPVIYLIDRLFKVKYNLPHWLILSAYFSIAVVFGLVTLYFRADMGETEIIPEYSFNERILVICFSVINAAWKIVYPISLAAIEAFPSKSAGGWLPVMVYVSPVCIAFAVFAFLNLKKSSPLAFTGILFFILNFLITQVTFLEDGFSANRYLYLSAIGIYLPVGFMIIKATEKADRYRYWIYPGLGVWLIFMAGITFRRSADWKDTITLTSSIISKSPDVIMAYNIRGIWYYNKKEIDRSIMDFNRAISIFPGYSSAYYNRGLSLNAKQDFPAAERDYNHAIKLNPNFVSAYIARGVLRLDAEKDYSGAMSDFKQAILLNPKNAQAYYNLGLVYFRMQNPEEACSYWRKVKALGYPQADGMIAKYCR
jgi:protein O-mannosyl-transferase